MAGMRFAAGLAAGLLLAGPAAAQGQGDTVVVSATRLQARDPAVTVLDPANRPAGSPTLAGLLRQAPGLHLDGPGGPGAVGSVYLGGGDPNHTLVLVDGVKANDPTDTRGGSADPTLLLASGIGRVEVARGALSPVHGSGAIGGVVSVAGRAAGPDPWAEGEASFGPAGHRWFQAGAGGATGPAGLALSAASLHTGSVPSGNRLEAGQVAARADLALGGSAVTATLRRTWHEAASFPEDAGGAGLAVNRALETREGGATLAGLSARIPLADAVRLELDGGYLRRVEDTDSPAVAPGLRDPFGLPATLSDNRFRRLTGTAALRYAAGGPFTALAGAGLEDEEGRSDASLDFGFFQLPARFDLQRQTRSLFAEAGYLPDQGLGARAGLRHDDVRGGSGRTTASASLLWRGEGLSASAGWAEGFKLPSFYSLGNPLVGNPALRPERSRTFQAAADADLPAGLGSARLVLFHTRVRDIVDFDPGPPPRLVNRGALRTRGGEASVTLVPAPGWEVAGFVALADADLSDGEPVRDRPRWRAGGSVAWQGEGWGLRATARHAGSLLDSALPTGDVRLGGGTTIDLGADWRPAGGVTLSLALENLADRTLRTRVGTPEPGRRLFAGLRFQL